MTHAWITSGRCSQQRWLFNNVDNISSYILFYCFQAAEVTNTVHLKWKLNQLLHYLPFISWIYLDFIACQYKSGRANIIFDVNKRENINEKVNSIDLFALPQL